MNFSFLFHNYDSVCRSILGIVFSHYNVFSLQSLLCLTRLHSINCDAWCGMFMASELDANLCL